MRPGARCMRQIGAPSKNRQGGYLLPQGMLEGDINERADPIL
jgi:hypothetical protein